jgi:hypothetical protein
MGTERQAVALLLKCSATTTITNTTVYQKGNLGIVEVFK